MKPTVLYIAIFAASLMLAVLVVFLGYTFKPELFGGGSTQSTTASAAEEKTQPPADADSAVAVQSTQSDTVEIAQHAALDSAAIQSAVVAALEDSLKKLSEALLLERNKQLQPVLSKPMSSIVKDTTPDSQTLGMAKMLEAMKPDQAVRILSNLDDTEAKEILRNLNKRQASKILAALDPTRAAKLIR